MPVFSAQSTLCVWGALDIAHGCRWEGGGAKVTFLVGRGHLDRWVPRGPSTELEISMDMGPSTPAERRF